MRTSWQPVLEGDAVDRAWRVIDHVTRALREPPREPANADDDPLRASLFAGDAGLAICFSYLARARGDDRALRELAARYLGHALDRVSTTSTDRPQLSYGFAGTSWALQHVGAYLGASSDDDDDPLVSVDAALAALVEAKPADAPFMLDTGLVGYGVYALERMPRSSARRCLQAVCAKLVAGAEPHGAGVCWRARASWMAPPTTPADDSRDHRHTGIRSGAAGPIAVLQAAARWGIADASRTAARGLEWLWHQRRDCHLPSVAGGSPVGGYAHGEVATAASLLASAPDDDATHELALSVARAAAETLLEVGGVADAVATSVSLEGGAAGDALAYLRLYVATGHEVFRDAARRVLDAVLAAYDPSIGLGGYRFHVPEMPPRALELRGISFGVAGVALVLLSAITSIEPAWDRMFLLSARDPDEP